MPTIKTAAEKPVTEIPAPLDTPSATPSAQKKGGSKGIIIVVVVLLLICCVCGTVVAGYYVFIGSIVKVSPTPAGQPGITYDSDVNFTPVANESQPELTGIIADFAQADSYKISSRATDEDGVFTLDGEFVSPNKEHAVADNQDEEISIGEQVYVRYADGGGWTTAEETSLTGFHQLFSTDVFPAISKDGDLLGEKDGYWYYAEGDAGTTRGQYQLYVNKTSELPAIFRLIVDNKEVLYVEFNEYNDSSIVIQAPL